MSAVKPRACAVRRAAASPAFQAGLPQPYLAAGIASCSLLRTSPISKTVNPASAMALISAAICAGVTSAPGHQYRNLGLLAVEDRPSRPSLPPAAGAPATWAEAGPASSG